jgi:sulfoxide reductase heme-binding subunit YedZ
LIGHSPVLAAATASNPSPLWFATRGAGVMTLVLLSATVILGIATSLRWEGRNTPRFVTAALHRNLSLFAIVLLAVHIATSVLDPFAGIRAADALVPFEGAYRTVWLSLGVLAAEVLTAVALTSLARNRVGPRTWRAIHWAAYASWPLAVIHGLGTGSDTQEPWLIGLTAACTTAVLLALLMRLVSGGWRTAPVRIAAMGVTVAAVVAGCSWAARGPLRPGWAAIAGAPTSLLSRASPSPGPVHTGRARFADPLVGSMVQTPAGAEIAFRDSFDPGLTLTIMPPDVTGSLPVITVLRDGVRICSAPARAVLTIYAVCGTTRIVVALFGSPAHLTGRLTASGPLR